MADLKISEMTPAAELTGAELIECVQGGVNVKQELTGLKTWVNEGVQPFSSTLDALSSFNTNGIMVQTDTSEFIGRTIEGTASQVTVTNGDGVAGNPTIGLAASGVVAGTYGSSSLIPVPVIDTYGRITGITTTAVVSPTTFSDSTFRIQDNGDATKQLAFEVSGIATSTTRTLTMPDANVDLGIIPNATSSTMATGTFVYATGMGSVVKTITGSGATFDIDELEANKAHSVTIRSNADNTFPFDTTTTFSFVSTKSFGAGTGFCDESGGTSLGTCASGSPFVVTLAPNESWEVRYMGVSGSVDYFSVKRNFTPWTAITADTSVSLQSGLSYITTNTSTGKTYTLPAAPTIGNIIKLKCNNFVAYNQTLARNGSPIDGVASNITLNRNGTYTFLYNALSTWETSFEDSVYLDANVISGTRNRVVGGTSNNVSGTDNVVVGCTAVTTSSSLGQYIQASSGSTAGIDWPTRFIGSGTLRGTTSYNTELAEVITQLKALNIYDAGSAVLTTDGGAATSSNTPKHAGACPYDDAASDVATHELDLQVVTRVSTGLYLNTGITHAKYLISVLDTTAVPTVVATCSTGTVATFTVTPTVVSGRLYITVANTTGSDKPVRVRGVLKSLYSYL